MNTDNCRTRGIRNSDTIHAESSSPKLLIASNKLNSDRLQIKLVTTTSLKPIKSTKIFVGDNCETQRLVLKANHASASLLFYHEASMEMRLIKEFALITRRTYHLQSLCASIGISSYVNDIKKLVDLEFIPHLSGLVVSFGMCLGLLLPREEAPRVIYQPQGEVVRSVQYEPKEKLLLVLGSQSISLLDVDTKGVVSSRRLESNFLKMDCRVLVWDSLSKMIVLAQLTAKNRENYHFIGYCSQKINQKTSILNKPRNSSIYCQRRKSLLYMEENRESRAIKSFPLLDADCDQESGECRIEGDIIACLPKETRDSQMTLCGLRKVYHLTKSLNWRECEGIDQVPCEELLVLKLQFS